MPSRWLPDYKQVTFQCYSSLFVKGGEEAPDAGSGFASPCTCWAAGLLGCRARVGLGHGRTQPGQEPTLESARPTVDGWQDGTMWKRRQKRLVTEGTGGPAGCASLSSLLCCCSGRIPGRSGNGRTRGDHVVRKTTEKCLRISPYCSPCSADARVRCRARALPVPHSLSGCLPSSGLPGGHRARSHCHVANCSKPSGLSTTCSLSQVLWVRPQLASWALHFRLSGGHGSLQAQLGQDLRPHSHGHGRDSGSVGCWTEGLSATSAGFVTMQWRLASKQETQP